MVYPAEVPLVMVLETGKSKNMVLVVGFLLRGHFCSLKTIVFLLSIRGSQTGTPCRADMHSCASFTVSSHIATGTTRF